MIIIDKLMAWENPGYTEGNSWVPPKGSEKLPTADFVSDPAQSYHPGKNSTFSKLELPFNYSQWHKMCYLYIECHDSGGTMKMYGWIRSVEEIAGTNPAVRIEWYPDYWRSFIAAADIREGHLLKTPLETHKRPYLTTPRKWQIYKQIDMCGFPGTDPPLRYEPCYILVWSETNAQQQVTRINYGFWHPGETIDELSAPTNAEVYNGTFTELLGIDPDRIIGLWVSPVAPYAGGTPFGTSRHIFKKTDSMIYSDFTIALPEAEYMRAGNMCRVVFSDFYGGVIGEIPWGYTVTGWTMYVDVGTAGCNLIIKVHVKDDPTETVINGTPELGLTISTPLISVPVLENAWSSYNYSGQREFERTQREIQRQEQFVSGITGAGTSALTGGLLGSGAGKTGIGAIAGFVASVIGSTAQYAVDKYIFEDQLQAANDALHSNQAANVVYPSSGMAWTFINRYTVSQLIGDNYSVSEYGTSIAYTGYDTDCISDIGTLITGRQSGAIKATDTVVLGKIPPEAKQWLRNKLSSGIYIVEMNPTGRTPTEQWEALYP